MLSFLLDMIRNLFIGYGRLTTIKGHSSHIKDIACTPQEKVLACGGIDGLYLYDISSNRKSFGTSVPCPLFNSSIRGTITKLTWLSAGKDAAILVSGTSSGFVVMWRVCRDVFSKGLVVSEEWEHRLPCGSEVLCITADAASSKLAVGTRQGVIQLWKLPIAASSSPIFTREITNVIPRELAFSSQSAAIDVYVYGMYDANIHCLHGQSGNLLGTSLGTKAIRFGHVSVEPEQATSDAHLSILIHNVASGFDLYKQQRNSAVHIRHFDTGRPQNFCPKQAAFGELGHSVVAGSDTGRVFVFQRNTGKIVQTLKHSRSGDAQVVKTFDTESHSYIFAASSSVQSKSTHISVFVRRRQQFVEQLRVWATCAVKTAQNILIVIGIVAIILAVIYGIGFSFSVPPYILECIRSVHHRILYIYDKNWSNQAPILSSTHAQIPTQSGSGRESLSPTIIIL